MRDGVKRIFATLIGTIVVIVLSSCIVEIVNISIIAIQLQQTVRFSCDKALTLYSQESYKQRTDSSGTVSGGSIDIRNIPASDGTVYMSGKFYDHDTVPEIYNDLYGSSSEFPAWVDSVGSTGNWKSINLLNRYLNDRGSFSQTTMPDYEAMYNIYGGAVDRRYNTAVDEYTDFLVGKSYVDTYMTPLNFGVPYVDSDVALRMFRWNLTQMLYANNPDMIRVDDDGNYYVAYKGFRIYANQATLNLEYRVYDLTDNSQKSQFMQLTNINPSNLGFSYDIEYLGTNDDERQRVCVIGASFTVPMAYEGITPLKSIFEYVWNTEVDGYGDTYDGFSKPYREYSFETDNMTGGGFNGNVLPDGALPVLGKLVFFVVR